MGKDKKLPRDKMLHLIIFFVLTFGFTVWLGTWIFPYAFFITAGILKEWIDSLGFGTEDVKDIYANTIGCALGALGGSLIRECAILFVFHQT